MPREITDDRLQQFTEQGLRAVRALSVGNAVTHMEGFLLEKGGARLHRRHAQTCRREDRPDDGVCLRHGRSLRLGESRG